MQSTYRVILRERLKPRLIVILDEGTGPEKPVLVVLLGGRHGISQQRHFAVRGGESLDQRKP